MIRKVGALAAGALVLTACAEAPAQHSARLRVERVAEQSGRPGHSRSVIDAPSLAPGPGYSAALLRSVYIVTGIPLGVTTREG